MKFKKDSKRRSGFIRKSKATAKVKHVVDNRVWREGKLVEDAS